MLCRFLEKQSDEFIFRKDAIVQLCTGVSVLHLGFIQHEHIYKELIAQGDWLHDKINKVASRLVGVDYLREVIEAMRQKTDYEVYVGDAMNLTDLPLQNTFDVIVCGELIEHVENPGLMLKEIRRFTHQKSRVVITTPNPWAINRIKLIKSGNLEKVWMNPEHVSWFTYQTLTNVLERMNYSCLIKDYYVAESRESIMNRTSGLMESLKFAKFVIRLHWISKHQYDGLFFVASPN